MNTTVYLLRHGRVENPSGVLYGTLPGFPLSEVGRRQINNLAEELKRSGVKILSVVSSPALRARETAEIVARAFGLPSVQIEERIGEWGMGRWVGGSVKEFKERSGYYGEPMRFDGLEPLRELAKRVQEAIDQYRQKFAGGSVLLVSHREPLVAALLSLQNRSWEEIHDTDFPVASVWEIVYTDAGEIASIKKVFDHHADP
ncbi:histidine phosphatase family protein [Patescibacteria group bacterium]|nr:MAG: histidine phosphatase family protein [Patescibacteria group bacterium]